MHLVSQLVMFFLLFTNNHSSLIHLLKVFQPTFKQYGQWFTTSIFYRNVNCLINDVFTRKCSWMSSHTVCISFGILFDSCMFFLFEFLISIFLPVYNDLFCFVKTQYLSYGTRLFLSSSKSHNYGRYHVNKILIGLSWIYTYPFRYFCHLLWSKIKARK